MPRKSPEIQFFTDRPKLVAGRDQTVDLLIRVKAPEPEDNFDKGTASRPHLNLAVTLDRSGSMAGEKIVKAREAAAYCVEELLATDRISLVIFDDVVETLVPSTLAANKSAILERLPAITARNSTALHEGWVRGGIQVSEHLTDGAINRVLLITDGRANAGLTNTDEIVSQAMALAERGVTTSTIGIGDDFNEDLLLPMAKSAGGNAWHVQKAGDLQSIFAVELEGLIAQAGHSVSLGLIPSDGVRLSDLLNDFEMNETGRYRLPNLQSGRTIDVVVQFRVPAQPVGARIRLVDLRLGYTRQDSTQAEVIKQFFEIGFDSEREVERLQTNPEVAAAVQLLMNARARREAVKRVDAGDYSGAAAVVAGAHAATQALFQAHPCSAPLQEEMGALNDLSGNLVEPAQAKMNRKRLAYGAYHLSHNNRRQI